LLPIYPQQWAQITSQIAENNGKFDAKTVSTASLPGSKDGTERTKVITAREGAALIAVKLEYVLAEREENDPEGTEKLKAALALLGHLSEGNGANTTGEMLSETTNTLDVGEHPPHVYEVEVDMMLAMTDIVAKEGLDVDEEVIITRFRTEMKRVEAAAKMCKKGKEAKEKY
jgi:hypothetical protein